MSSSSRRSSRNISKPQQAHPAPAASAPAAAPAGDGAQQQKKARFTRAEKRAFAREKAQNPFLPSRPKQQSKAQTIAAPRSLRTNHEAPNANIDNMIGFLLAQRGAGKKQQAKAINSVFQGFKLDQPAAKPKAAPKKELSAAKLEKIQKRKEVRAEKRQIYLAEKAKKAEAQVTESTATATFEQQPLPADDEINYDEFYLSSALLLSQTISTIAMAPVIVEPSQPVHTMDGPRESSTSRFNAPMLIIIIWLSLFVVFALLAGVYTYRKSKFSFYKKKAATDPDLEVQEKLQPEEQQSTMSDLPGGGFLQQHLNGLRNWIKPELSKAETLAPSTKARPRRPASWFMGGWRKAQRPAPPAHLGLESNPHEYRPSAMVRADRYM
ncbi:hypothetical protein BDV96DRAFT_636496 [Lophiotrema nucula]|uniref:Uncharacterized protein n=1 Tax=Lophiotrema nucula TaxID=690887 RepID=A0A6A5YNR0_9PLEO|nr:hypothetical protein BDV96DRAFT_636496 [Lophiotrema nucula]